LQAKLLRVLEEQQVLRVGATSPRRVDVRFIAATNRDLGSDIERGRFRSDLFFRLNGVAIRIPPLRERPADIVPLARAILTWAAARAGRAAPMLDDAATALLERHPWPGNVRELRQTLERAMFLCDGLRIRPEHLVLSASEDRGTPD